MDEGRLLARIARGDRAAFDEFYRRTAPWLAVRLRRRCADDDVVAEVMQETYLAVWRAAAAFTGVASAGDGSAVGWLWTIAAHRLIDAFRRRARDVRPWVALAAEAARTAPAAEDEALAGAVGDPDGRRAAPPRPRAARGAPGDGARRADRKGDLRAARRAGRNGQDPGQAGRIALREALS